MPSWDDWVPQDRIRKMNEDNKALAANLKFEMDKLLRPKAVAASNKKKAAGSDLSSNRGSEERHATPTTGRGQKRGRDYEIEKVREKIPSKPGDLSSSSHGSDGKSPALEDEKSGLRRSKRLKANTARSAKVLLASSSKSATPTTSYPKPGPSKTKCRRSKAPKPLPTIASRCATNVSRVKLVTPAQMKRSWTASCHHTASSCFEWAGLHSDIHYEDLDEAERKAGFPTPGFRLPEKDGNPRPKLPSRRLPPTILHAHSPREKIHLYYKMRRLIGLVGDDEPPPPTLRAPFVKAGIPLEDNTPEDLVDHVKKQRAKLINKSNTKVQFTNRANDR